MILFYIAGWLAFSVMVCSIIEELYILPKYHKRLSVLSDGNLVVAYALFFIACVVTL